MQSVLKKEKEIAVNFVEQHGNFSSVSSTETEKVMQIYLNTNK